MVHKSPSAVKFTDCNAPAFTSVTPTVILTWPPAILQCNGSSLGTCISSSLAQQRHQTGAQQKVTVCPFLYFTHCFHFLIFFFFSLQINFQLVIDVRGGTKARVGQKTKTFFYFLNLHWISIFKTNHHSLQQAALCNLFTLLCSYDFFTNCIYFSVHLFQDSLSGLMAGAELISHTQTPAHSHPADHSQASMDKQKPGLQERAANTSLSS